MCKYQKIRDVVKGSKAFLTRSGQRPVDDPFGELKYRFSDFCNIIRLT